MAQLDRPSGERLLWRRVASRVGIPHAILGHFTERVLLYATINCGHSIYSNLTPLLRLLPPHSFVYPVSLHFPRVIESVL